MWRSGVELLLQVKSQRSRLKRMFDILMQWCFHPHFKNTPCWIQRNFSRDDCLYFSSISYFSWPHRSPPTAKFLHRQTLPTPKLLTRSAPLSVGNSRVKDNSTPLNRTGTRAQTRSRWARRSAVNTPQPRIPAWARPLPDRCHSMSPKASQLL